MYHDRNLTPAATAVETAPRLRAGWQVAVRDLCAVLYDPVGTFRRERSSAEVAWLFLVVAGIDFVLSLLLLPTFLDAIEAAGPQLTAGARVSAIGIALVLSSSVNCIIIGFMAMLFMLALLVATGKASFRGLVGSLLLATSPLIVDRIIRLTVAAIDVGRNPTESLVPLSLLVPVDVGGDLSRALGFFGLFDLWTFVLVVIGVRFAAGGRALAPMLIAFLLWGGLQALFLRLYLSGLFGA